VTLPPSISSPSGSIVVDVDADHGGRIAQITIDGIPLLIARSEQSSEPGTWGAFPMVPWAGRIRHGRFEFRGVPYRVPANFGDHAMHGVGFTMAWDVTGRGATTIGMRLALPADDRWPFGGVADQRIEVSDEGVECTMRVAAGEQPFPVSFGWHPWFRKPSRFEFHPERMYRRDDEHIAVDELVDVSAGPWDDCFVNRRPVEMTIDGVDVRVVSDCIHWVVYDEQADTTCVEPQTGPPDAFNIAPVTLEPGATVAASYRIEAV
jgi:aldose 1-epimerase